MSASFAFEISRPCWRLCSFPLARSCLPPATNLGGTQGGNNNAYCQDNATTWLDWANRDKALEDFVASLARERASHLDLFASFPEDAEWLSLEACPLTGDDWESASAVGFVLRTTCNGESFALGLIDWEEHVSIAFESRVAHH